VVIETLSDRHNRTGFDCGVPRLNEFLKRTARQHVGRDVGVTHVVVEAPGATEILGFVTLTMKSVGQELLPNAGKLPTGDYTVAFIGQLAVGLRRQSLGIGKHLLYFALEKSLEVAGTFGLQGVAFDLHRDEDEPDDVALARCRFYMDRGFKPLTDDGNRLYISMSEVRKMGLV
jgi:GNAT superfamily N-acetyltransferase